MALLQTLYQVLQDGGEWPSYSYLDRRLSWLALPTAEVLMSLACPWP